MLIKAIYQDLPEIQEIKDESIPLRETFSNAKTNIGLLTHKKRLILES